MNALRKTTFKVKTKTVRESITSFVIGKAKKGGVGGESRNCECTNGVLRAGIGVEQVFDETHSYAKRSKGLPSRCQFFAWPGVDALGEPTQRIGALGDNGILYSYFSLSNKWVAQHTFTSKMRAVRVVDANAQVKTAFIGAQGLFVLVYGEAVEETGLLDLGEKAHLACFAQGRLFFVQAPHTLRFSKAYEPTNFVQSVHDGGEVHLPSEYGDVVDLLALGDKVYVVYERGISMVSVRGSACDFTVRTITHHGGRIFEGSVSAWGVENPKLFFLTEQGICRLQGERIDRVCTNLDICPKFFGRDCEHGSFEGRYVLAYYDQDDNRRCVVVDGETGEGFFTINLFCLSEYKGGTICRYGEYLYHLHRKGGLPETEEYQYTVRGVRFGDDTVKRLDAIEIAGAYDGEVRVDIHAGQQNKVVSLKLGEGQNRAPVHLSGKVFDFYFILSQKACMYELTVEITRILSVK